MKKHWLKVLIGLAVLVVLIVVIVPLFVNANTFRPMLESELSSTVGRKVTLGNLSFSLFSGSIVADNVTVADDPTFSTAPFLQAKSLRIGVETGPLIFHRQVKVTDFVAESPSINLIHGQNGRWNFSSLGGAAAAQPQKAQQATAIPDLTVGKLEITNGTATVSSLPATGKPFVYTNVDVAAQNFSLAKSFPFQLSAKLPGNGDLQLTGTAGPVAVKDASDTPFQASLELKHFDPVAAGAVDPSQGVSMVADVNAQAASNGNVLTSSGKISASRLQLVRTGSPAPQPVTITYNMSDNLDARTGQVQDLAITTGAVAAHVTGSFQLTQQAPAVDMHLSAPNLPVDQLEQLLPAVGVHLPSGSSLHGGTLTANLGIKGPATALAITGPVEVDNTELAGFDLGSKIQGLKALGGTQGGTSIQTVRAEVNSTPQITQFTNIYGSVPQIGTATGEGTVSPAGALDFRLLCKLNTNSGVGALAGAAANALGGLLGGIAHSAVSNGVPLVITGTGSNPSIRADLSAMLRPGGKTTGQQQTSNPAKTLQNLFGVH